MEAVVREGEGVGRALPRYEVSLTGVSRRSSPELVVRNLARAFGVGESAAERLVRSAPVAVKRDVELSLALRYAEALRCSGALFEVRRTAESLGELRSQGANQPNSRALAEGALPTSREEREAAGAEQVLLYFKPRESLEWPERCAVCFGDVEEGSSLTLDTSAVMVTEERRAGKVGGFVGEAAGEAVGLVAGEVAGAFGGFIGRAVVGAMVNEVSKGEAEADAEDFQSSFEVPVCSKCLAKFEKEELAALSEATDDTVCTPNLTRSFVGRVVCLGFRSGEFAANFQKRNRGIVFREPEEASESKQREPIRGDERMGDDGAPIEERLRRHLSTFQPMNVLHVAPDIPRKKMLAAWRFCGVSSSVPIVGLIDLTVFGSAEKCLMISPSGIHFSNGRKGRPPRGKVTFEELVEFEPRLGDQEISVILAPGLEVNGGAADVRQVLEILRSIRRGLERREAKPIGASGGVASTDGGGGGR